MVDYTGTTDENGKLTIKKVPVGKYDVTATKEGYADYNGEVTVDKDIDLNIKLNKTRSINFTITHSQDGGEPQPISDAVVMIGNVSRTTGSAGGCSFPAIEDGEHLVHVATEGYGGANATINVSENETSFNINIVAEDYGYVYVTYNDGNNNVKNGMVVYNGVYSLISEGLAYLVGINADEDYEITVESDGFYPKTVTVHGTQLKEQQCYINLDVITSEVMFKVLDSATNDPVANVNVSCSEEECIWSYDGVTDDNGQVTFNMKRDMEYTVSLFVSDYEQKDITGVLIDEPEMSFTYTLSKGEPQE